MNEGLFRKGMVLAFIGCFVGACVIPTSVGLNISEKNNAQSPILTPNIDYNENITFTDYVDDVFHLYFDVMYLTDKKPNVDIINAGYSKSGEEVILTLEVKGKIESRGNINDSNDFVGYLFLLNSSDNFYQIIYCNKTCVLYRGFNETPEYLSNFWVDGNTLSISFNLNDISETYDFLEIATIDILYFEIYLDAANDREYSLDIEITKPKKALYILNREIIPFFSPVIIGKINVEIEELLNETDVMLIELYVDGKLIETSSGDSSLTWSELSFGKHMLKVIAYDYLGNRDSQEIEVWKFF